MSRPTNTGGKTGPHPVRDKTGWHVNFRLPGGGRCRKKFPAAEHGEGPEAAESYIRQMLTVEESVGPANELASRVREYLNWKEKIKKIKGHTLRGDTIRLRIFCQFCESKRIKHMNRIDIKLIREFQVYYLSNAPLTTDRRRSPKNPHATWEKYRQILAAFLGWAMKREYITTNPAADDEFKEEIESTIPEIFTAEELQAIFAYMDMRDEGRPVPWLGAAFRFLAYTGARPGEMWGLKWENLDLKGKIVKFRGTKTKFDRVVPVNRKLLPFLKRLPHGDGYVFGSGDKQLYTESNYWRILDAALRDAGAKIPGRVRNLYTFRHTFAANLCMAGVSLPLVKTLMGHRLVTTTMIYAEHFYRQDRELAVDRLPY